MSNFTKCIDALGNSPQPFITFYDGPNRTELSGITTANWVMKAANYLSEEHEGVAQIQIAAPAHWQTMVWMVAAWRLGIPTSTTRGDLKVIGFNQSAEHENTLVLSLHPFALPCAEHPEIGIDVNREVLNYPDALLFDPQVSEDSLLCADLQMNHRAAFEMPPQPRLLLQASEFECEKLIRAITSQHGLVVTTATSETEIDRIKQNEKL